MVSIKKMIQWGLFAGSLLSLGVFYYEAKRLETVLTVFGAEQIVSYSDKFVEDPFKSMCSKEASKMSQWCDENYRNKLPESIAKIPGLFDVIDSTCNLSRHSERDYQRNIDDFLDHLDDNSTLRRTIEQTIYISENEGIIDISRDGEDFSIDFSDDPSDKIYLEMISRIKTDPIVQAHLEDVLSNIPQAEELFLQRIDEVIDDTLYSGDLEGYEEDLQETVADDLRQYFSSSRFKDILTVYQGEYDTTYRNVEESERKIRHTIDEFNQALLEAEEKLGPEVDQLSLENLYGNRNLGIDLLQKIDSHVEEGRELSRMARSMFVKELWSYVFNDQLRYQVSRTVRGGEVINPDVIAFGHSHPLSNLENVSSELAGPSVIDSTSSIEKPKLVFTALSDRWQVYVAICGKSTLAREYERTLNYTRGN